jgi:hypothetical protein
MHIHCRCRNEARGKSLNRYRTKTDAELAYIAKDAKEAAEAMRGLDARAEAKYLDQVNDACTEMYRRRNTKKGAAA